MFFFQHQWYYRCLWPPLELPFFQAWDLRQLAAMVRAAIFSFQKDSCCCSVAPAVRVFSVVPNLQPFKGYF